MPTRWQIGLAWVLCDYSNEALNGIIEYSHRYGPFRFLGTFGREFAPGRLSKPPRIDGLLSYCSHPHEMQINQLVDVPTVNIGFCACPVISHRVHSDNFTAGKMAAEEFLGRGIRRLAYCPYAWLQKPPHFVNLGSAEWDQERREGFLATARAAGAQAFVYHANLGDELYFETEWSGPLAAWIKSLPKPIGIMGANDFRARHLLMAAELTGARVPDDVAIIGVDNTNWTRMTDPPISSIELDAFHVGYSAMEMLHQLLEGRPVPQQRVLIPPRRLIRRGSSDILAIDDSDVIDAMRYIERHATAGISVEQVVDSVAVSRRGLERRFQNCLHSSILDKIRDVQIERAKLLLADPGIPINRVARESGFHSAVALSTIFHRMTGMTPSAYRAAELAGRDADEPNSAPADVPLAK